MSTSSSVLAALLASLGVAVLERSRDGRLALVTRPPEWFSHLFPDVRDHTDESALGKRAPFLAAFLSTAAPFWDNGSTGRLRSGPWMEVDAFGATHYLEASAFCADSVQLLVLEAGDRDLGRAAAILQKARETMLANEALAKELAALRARDRERE